MKTTSFKFHSIAAAICIGGLSYAQSYNSISERTKKVIDSTYTSLIKKNKIIGASIAIVDHGEIVYATGYGFSDLIKKTKADEKTVYRIGSCTKSFTALSILQLQEKKLISVNSSVKTYLPELKITSRFDDNNQFLIRELLSHTSGLPCDIMNGFFCDSPPDINWVINELNKQTTMSPHSYMHAYSNIAYGLLGEVIARQSKLSYSDYIKKNIFEPLQMNSSYIEYDEKLAANFSKGYYHTKEIKEPLIRDQAAGLIHSNVLDMANYLNMYLANGKFRDAQVISAPSLEEMEKNQLTSLQLGSSENWGFGLYTSEALIKKEKDSSVVRVIGHGGDTYVFHADFKFIPELNIGAIILTNTSSGGRIADAGKLLKIYLKEMKTKLVLNYKSPTKETESKAKETLCRANDISGNYNFGPMVMKVKYPKKMSFKQGPAKLIFTQKKSDSTKYTAKAIVYHIIPTKIKNQEFSFVKVNDGVYFKGVNTKYKSEDYIAIKTSASPIPASWKNKLGKYKAIGTIYKCVDCPFLNMDGMSMTLSEEKGSILIKSQAKTSDTKSDLYLNVISDNLAVGGGIGRGSGETVKILENGNIYYSGFEFAKVK